MAIIQYSMHRLVSLSTSEPLKTMRVKSMKLDAKNLNGCTKGTLSSLGERIIKIYIIGGLEGNNYLKNRLTVTIIAV